MSKRIPALSAADRAVYDLVARGGIDAAHAALYRRQLSALGRAGLVQRDAASGAYSTTAARPITLAPPPSTPPLAPAEPPMVTVTCRVPLEIAAAIESATAPGAHRADTIRAALARGLGSGTRKAVRNA